MKQRMALVVLLIFSSDRDMKGGGFYVLVISDDLLFV